MQLTVPVSDVRRTTMAVTLMVSAAAPAFMVGALAGQIGRDFRFGAGELGLAMTTCYTSAGLLSPIGARVVARLGGQGSARATGALGILGLSGLAVAQNLMQVLAASVFFGLSNALCQPASNQLLSRLEHPRRRALGFGVVQASMPMGALLAGLSLTVTSHGVDWRLVVTLVAVGVALAQLVHVPVTTATTPVGAPRTRPSPQLVLLIVAGTLASAAASALPLFLATAGQAQGMTAFAIASAQIAGSIGSIIVRTSAPLVVSRASARRRFALLTGLMCTGCLGMLLLATGSSLGFVAGALLGFTFGWGWNGLYNQLISASSGGRVAAATGLSQTGIFLGGTAGPALVAVLVVQGSFAAAWLTLAVIMAVAAATATIAAPTHRKVIA